MKALLDGGYFYEDCLTVNGKTIKENLENINVDYSSQNIVFPVEKPISPTGGVIGLKGNLAPDGAIVKVAGMNSQFLEEMLDVLIVKKMHLKQLVKKNIKKEML